MTDLERIQIERADEQLQSFDAKTENHLHDPWAVRPRKAAMRGQGRQQGSTYHLSRYTARSRCWVDGCMDQVYALGYCRSHYSKMRSGFALDLDGIEEARSDAKYIKRWKERRRGMEHVSSPIARVMADLAGKVK